jgi:acetyltransferase-like isoleucine patch superfamily enzyme
VGCDVIFARALIARMRRSLADARAVERLIRANPHARIGRGVKILGNAEHISMGGDCEIDDGAILDFRFGGAIALGARVTVRSGAILAPYGGTIAIGDDSGVNHYTILYGHGGLKIGKFVRFAAHCLVVPANHGFDDLSQPITRQPLSMQGIAIGDDVWVGGHCTILDGVSIGDGAVIAAGSVVTKPVAPLSVVAGTPARRLKSR